MWSLHKTLLKNTSCLHSFMSRDLTAILKMQWQKTEAFLVVIYNEVFADTCCLKAWSYASTHSIIPYIFSIFTHTHARTANKRKKVLIQLLQVYLEHLLFINIWIFFTIHKNLKHNWIKIYKTKRKNPPENNQRAASNMAHSKSNLHEDGG